MRGKVCGAKSCPPSPLLGFELELAGREASGDAGDGAGGDAYGDAGGDIVAVLGAEARL